MTVRSVFPLIAGPSAALAFAVLVLEWAVPGIVARWHPIAPLFFGLLASAVLGTLMRRPRA